MKTHIEVLKEQLEDIWAKIEILKERDPLYAHVLYEEYKRLAQKLADELPPDLPTQFIIDDQCVS